MEQSPEELFGKTTDVMTKVVAQAHEARQAGASRRSFFSKTAALAGTTVLGAAGARFMLPIAAKAAETTTETSADTAQEIVDLAATAEALATTFYFHALGSATLPLVNNKANRNYFQAATVQEFQHLKYLKQIGATPMTTEFYYPEGMFSKESIFFPTASLLEDYFISAYIAAAMEFSGVVSTGIPAPYPFGIGLAVQIAGIECEHRALLRVAAGLNPPNNRIVESALLQQVSDVVTPLTPFLQPGAGYEGPYKMPTHGEVNAIALPYGFASFPPFTIV